MSFNETINENIEDQKELLIICGNLYNELKTFCNDESSSKKLDESCKQHYDLILNFCNSIKSKSQIEKNETKLFKPFRIISNRSGYKWEEIGSVYYSDTVNWTVVSAKHAENIFNDNQNDEGMKSLIDGMKNRGYEFFTINGKCKFVYSEKQKQDSKKHD